MKKLENIDVVVLWVDDTDSEWQAKKNRYTGTKSETINADARYRNWDTFKYWFRGVEKFAPWVRYVYLVTDDQKPEWLNIDHPKLKWVKHTDFIPQEYLPTFNSNVIDWNLCRIEGLSDKFLYFNDDVFFIKKTKPEDFFINGLPCDLPCLGPLYPDGFFSYTIFNNINLLNRHFSLRKSVKEKPSNWIKGQKFNGLFKLLMYTRRSLIPNSVSWHLHFAYNKKNFETLWEKEYDVIHETCKHKLRTKDDVSHWCVRDWQLFSNEFYPKKPVGKYFVTNSLSQNDEIIKHIEMQKSKIICLNDTEDETDFENHKAKILAAFEKILPDKSSFEL